MGAGIEASRGDETGREARARAAARAGRERATGARAGGRAGESRAASVAKACGMLFRDTGQRWADDACYRLGSSLAYAALFSIFPLVLLAITAVGFVLGSDATAHRRVVDSLASATAPEFRALLDQTLSSLQTHRTARGVGAAVGMVTLLVGASGVFAELQSSLNLIWRVKPESTDGVWSTIFAAVKAKAFSFGVVVVAALVMLALLVASTWLAAVGGAAGATAGGKVVWQIAEVALSIASLTLLLSAVYRFVPQTEVAWRDVLPGAGVAAVLFTALKNLLAWYLGHLGNYAAYGAIGGVLGLLTWIYVASLVVFFGAELGRVYAERFGTLARRAPESRHAGSSAAKTRGASRP